MKHVRKNAVRQIESIIMGMSDCVAHNRHNHYEGEPYAPEERMKRSIMRDVTEGYAILYKTDGEHKKEYMLQYAGDCRLFFN